jgi:hypothetical protein
MISVGPSQGVHCQRIARKSAEADLIESEFTQRTLTSLLSPADTQGRPPSGRTSPEEGFDLTAG